MNKILELREKRALCYQVGSYVSPYRQTGALQITASGATERARELVQRTLAECDRLGTLSGSEINAAKIILANEVTTLLHGAAAAASAERHWELKASGQWYDFAVTCNSDPAYYRRFAGRVETGQHTISDPAMGEV